MSPYPELTEQQKELFIKTQRAKAYARIGCFISSETLHAHTYLLEPEINEVLARQGYTSADIPKLKKERLWPAIVCEAEHLLMGVLADEESAILEFRLEEQAAQQ